jgi:hypothetical protein
MRGGKGTWTALAVGAAMLVVVPAQEAQAATCPFTSATVPGTVHTWQGSVDDSWGIAANWSTGDVPNDNSAGDGTPETSETFVCIPDGMGVVLDDEDLSNFSSNQVVVQAFWLGVGATIEIHDGVGLFSMSHTVASVVESGAELDVTSGFLGGEGAISVHGEVSIQGSGGGAASLMTTPGTMPVQLQSRPGALVVQQSGLLSFPNLGVNVRRHYQVHLAGRAELTGSGFIAADWGTALFIGATGVLDIGNDTGYLQGIKGDETELSDLVNGGLVRKSAGNGVSVVDADYQEVGAGAVEVQSGTLALPDGNTHPAHVAAARTLSTGKCAPREQLEPCVLTTVPAQDPQSVSFRVPGSDGDGARVQIREEAPREFTAHADGLATPPSDPALITMRIGQGLAGTGDPAALDVVHVDDRGVETVLGACPAVGLPAGVTNCVDTAASVFDGANVYKVVRTTDTSRYICRKEDLVAPVFLVPPATAKPKVRLGRPIVVTAAINEGGRIEVKGKIKTKRVRVKGLTLKGTATPAPGEVGRVVLKLTKAQKKKLRRAGAEKGTVTLTVVATDRHGNATTVKIKKYKLT